MKMKVDRLYGKREEFEKEKARKASVVYKDIGFYLKNNGFDVRKITQRRNYPSSWSSVNYPLGIIEVHTNHLKDVNKIMSLSKLAFFSLGIYEGHEKQEQDPKGMHGVGYLWKNVGSFLKCYKEMWGRREKPDYLVICGEDPTSTGEIVLRIGQLPKPEPKTLTRKLNEPSKPDEVSLN